MLRNLNIALDKEKTIVLRDQTLTEAEMFHLIAQLGKNKNLTSLTLHHIGLTKELAEHLYEEVLRACKTLQELVVTGHPWNDILIFHSLAQVTVRSDIITFEVDTPVPDLFRELKVDIDDLITNKFNPTYLSNLIAAARQLKDNAPGLNIFFNRLLCVPRDVAAGYELVLFMHCLNACELSPHLMCKDILVNTISANIRYYLSHPAPADVIDRVLEALGECPNLYKISPIKDELLALLKADIPPLLDKFEYNHRRLLIFPMKDNVESLRNNEDAVKKIVHFIRKNNWNSEEVADALCDFVENENYWRIRYEYAKKIGAGLGTIVDLTLHEMIKILLDIVGTLGRIHYTSNNSRIFGLLTKLANGNLCQSFFVASSDQFIWKNININQVGRNWKFSENVTPPPLAWVIETAKNALDKAIASNPEKYEKWRKKPTVEEQYNKCVEQIGIKAKESGCSSSELGTQFAELFIKQPIYGNYFDTASIRLIARKFEVIRRAIFERHNVSIFSTVVGICYEDDFFSITHGLTLAPLGSEYHRDMEKIESFLGLKPLRKDDILELMQKNRLEVVVELLSWRDLTSHIALFARLHTSSCTHFPEIFSATPLENIFQCLLDTKDSRVFQFFCYQAIKYNIPISYEDNKICFQKDDKIHSFDITLDFIERFKFLIKHYLPFLKRVPIHWDVFIKDEDQLNSMLDNNASSPSKLQPAQTVALVQIAHPAHQNKTAFASTSKPDAKVLNGLTGILSSQNTAAFSFSAPNVVFSTTKSATKRTTADGDCAVHALCGVWNTARNAYHCNDVAIQRKTVADAMKECKPGDELFAHVKFAIAETIIHYSNRKKSGLVNQVSEVMQSGIDQYMKFEEGDIKQRDTTWLAFESILNREESIVRYINAQINPQVNFKTQFQMCLNKKDSQLDQMIKAHPNAELRNAYLKYIEVYHFDWDKLLENRKIIEDYTDTRMRPLGQYLLTNDLKVMAHVLGIMVDYDVSDARSGKVSHNMIFNPEAKKRVKIRFNGSNHFSRGEEAPPVASSAIPVYSS